MTPLRFQRARLIIRYLRTDRDQPDLARLGGIDDAETFVWAILPHAARTFATPIVLLPESSARAAAVAYLYCRMLDSYEDLVPDRAAREAALRQFADRLDTTSSALAAAPPITPATGGDARDRAHLLLVERATLVDRVFVALDPAVRAVIVDLVRDMASGMQWSSSVFAEQGGVLETDEQLAAYCRHVLGNPAVFGIRLVLLSNGHAPTLSAEEREHAMRVGELVQLANVTRDVEKDLRRGVAYDASLRPLLGRRTPMDDESSRQLIAAARRRFVGLALARAPSYAHIMRAMRVGTGVSLARAAAVAMLLFTERFYRDTSLRLGLGGWRAPNSAAAVVIRALLAAGSAGRAVREVGRVERALSSVHSSLVPRPSPLVPRPSSLT